MTEKGKPQPSESERCIGEMHRNLEAGDNKSNSSSILIPADLVIKKMCSLGMRESKTNQRPEAGSRI